MAKKQTKGYCKYCGKEYTKSGMLKHLPQCLQKYGVSGGKKRKKKYFELVLSDANDSTYWLIVQAKATAKLRGLDQFIRDIWVECCGHLSEFEIEGVRYEDPSEASIFGVPSESTDTPLEESFIQGMQIMYRYDFGSSTIIRIQVTACYEADNVREDFTILSRNQPISYTCSNCGVRPAKWCVAEGMYFEKPYWCDACAEEAEKSDSEEAEYVDYLLPVCNSPRMGVCGYGGSEKYGDEFVPDVGLPKQTVKTEKAPEEKPIDPDDYIMPHDRRIDQLFDRAMEFRKAKLWDKLWDTELFAVQHANGVIGYCCIMGKSGEYLAVADYPGDEGLQSLRELMRRPKRLADGVEYTMRQDCLACGFENKAQLRYGQLAAFEMYCARRGGLRVRGARQYPQLERYRPCFYPWDLTEDAEKIYLLETLDACLEVAKRLENTKKKELGFSEGSFFDREIPLLIPGEKYTWTMHRLPDPVPHVYPKSTKIDARLAAKVRKSRRMIGEVAVDTFYMPQPVMDEEDEKALMGTTKAPYFPMAQLVVDAAYGMLLDGYICSPEEAYEDVLSNQLLKVFAKCGKPERIIVCNERTKAYCAGVGKKIGVPVVLKDVCESLDYAEKEMFDYMANGIEGML